MVSQPTPGWYPDPRSWAHLRWWDGRQWTDTVQPAMSAGGPSVGQVPARSHPVRVALIVVAAVLALALFVGGTWIYVQGAGYTEGPPAAGASAPARFAPRSPPASPTASPTVVTPPAVAESPSADATASILVTRAAELSGTAYVANDRSVSMVVSKKWVPLPALPGNHDTASVTTHGSWTLSSVGPGESDVLSVTTQQLDASIGLDTYVTTLIPALAHTLDGFELVSDDHVTTTYGDPARMIRFRCTVAGATTESLDYLMVDGRTAAEFTVWTSPARFDKVVAEAMPFISTLTVPADG